MSTEPATLDVEDGVATVTLDRPERRNAMSAAMADAVQRHVESIADRDDVRCVVVTGAGGAFCAGGDIERMRERAASDAPVDDHARELRRTVSAGVASVATCPLPTVAKIDGPAVGAGATLAVACDLQVASDEAVVGFSFRQVGLSVDSGASYLLPRAVGANAAKRLVFTGEIVDADRALDLGLLTHVFPRAEFEARAGEVVETVANGPTVALRHAKRLLDESPTKSYRQAVADEAVAQGLVYDSADHREGVEAFLEKRDPEFEGR
jgi:enoyl-CoA hydratase/carnithine racemase